MALTAKWHTEEPKNLHKKCFSPYFTKNPQGTAGWPRGQSVPEGKRTRERINGRLTANSSQRSEVRESDKRRCKKKKNREVLFRERREYTGRKRPNKREEVTSVSLGTLKGEAQSLMLSHSESSATASLFLMLRSVLFQDFWSASLCIKTISF